VPVVLQRPVRVRGEPVVVVAVEDDRRVRRDAALAEQMRELFLACDVPVDLVLETWPFSYFVGSTSTSTTRMPLSFPCSATQSVVTRALVVVDELNSNASKMQMTIR
jgi:hypothetical protein